MAPHTPGRSTQAGGSGGVGTRGSDNVCPGGAQTSSSPLPVPVGKEPRKGWPTGLVQQSRCRAAITELSLLHVQAPAEGNVLAWGFGGLQLSPPGPHCRALGLDVVSQAGLAAPGRGQAWVPGQWEGASLCWQAQCPAGHAGSRGTSRPAHQRLPSAVPVERPLGGRTVPGGTRRCCRTVPGPAGPGG